MGLFCVGSQKRTPLCSRKKSKISFITQRIRWYSSSLAWLMGNTIHCRKNGRSLVSHYQFPITRWWSIDLQLPLNYSLLTWLIESWESSGSATAAHEPATRWWLSCINRSLTSSWHRQPVGPVSSGVARRGLYGSLASSSCTGCLGGPSLSQSWGNLLANEAVSVWIFYNYR